MPKQLLLTLILVNLFCIAHAQKGKFELGFQGGVNISSAYGNGIAKKVRSARTGLGIGGYVKLNTSKHFGIKAVVEYDQYGWTYRSLVFESNIFFGGSSDVKYKFNYINLPVLAEYQFGRKIKFHVDAGVFVGTLLNSRITSGEAPPYVRLNTTALSSEYYRKINLGLAAGVGARIPLSRKIVLNIDARNSTGVLDIFKPKQGNIKTNALSLLTGIGFQL